MHRFTSLALLTSIASCGGAPFTADLLHPGGDGGTGLDAGQDAPGSVEGSTGMDAPADAWEAGVDAAQGHDAAPDVGQLDAPAEGEAGPTCITDLSNVGTGDFRVRFTIATAATAASSVLSQRSACGTSTFWDVQTGATGTISMETDDGTTAGDVLLYSLATVNDGASHHVDLARLAGVLSITIDGAASGATADTTSLGALAPLRVGTSICDGTAGVVALVGTVSAVCLTR